MALGLSRNRTFLPYFGRVFGLGALFDRYLQEPDAFQGTTPIEIPNLGAIVKTQAERVRNLNKIARRT
jgi:hypothetical protein